MDAKEEIKGRLSIEDVIGEYVTLKRAGRNWKGLSPFGNEKTPSFVVSPEKQIWHDFSSGRGGDIFTFVMEMEGVDFKEAMELLARKANVDLGQYRTASGGKRGPDKERLYGLLEAAARFYQVQFSRNKPALEYVFKKRQFTKETALEWRLGYSPNTGDALVSFLQSRGFTAKELHDAGVVSQRRNGTGDMFRGRLMIPLQDAQGRVIGFTARLLADDPQAPKYINTPATVLYDKSRHVYGLHLAKDAIRKTKFAVLAEGNLDVIASHQAGVRQVVATAGTALTEAHLKALSRFTGDIRLSFDADKAGINATERAIPIASKAKVSLSIITIPSGKDPDELIKQDPEIWKQTIAKPEYALDWLIGRYRVLLDIDSGAGKREFSDVLIPVIQALDDPVEKDHYLVQIAKMIGVSREALDSKARIQQADARTAPLRRKKTESAAIDRQTVEDKNTQDRFLALMLLQPKLRDHIEYIRPEMLHEPQAQELLQFLVDNPGFSGKPAEVAGLKRWGDYVKIVVLQYEELYQGLELTELRYEAARLQARLVERFVKAKKQKIAAQLSEAGEAEMTTLLEEAKKLDTLLKNVTGSRL